MRKRNIERDGECAGGVTFRPSKETVRQLMELAELWGENRSRAIVRAVQLAYNVTFPTRLPSQKA